MLLEHIGFAACLRPHTRLPMAINSSQDVTRFFCLRCIARNFVSLYSLRPRNSGIHWYKTVSEESYYSNPIGRCWRLFSHRKPRDAAIFRKMHSTVERIRNGIYIYSFAEQRNRFSDSAAPELREYITLPSRPSCQLFRDFHDHRCSSRRSNESHPIPLPANTPKNASSSFSIGWCEEFS